MANETWAEEKATLIISLVKNAETPVLAHRRVVEQLDALVDRAIAGSKASHAAAAHAKAQEHIDKTLEEDRARRAERAEALVDDDDYKFNRDDNDPRFDRGRDENRSDRRFNRDNDRNAPPARQPNHDYKAGERASFPGGVVGVAASDGTSGGAEHLPEHGPADGTVTWNFV